LNGHPSAEFLYGTELLDCPELMQDRSAVFIVESELDALTMQAHRFVAVSVSSAASTLSNGKLKILPEQLEKVSSAERIFVATDMDEAGNKCAEALQRALPLKKTFRVSWPYQGKSSSDPKDIGDLYVQDPGGFRERISQLAEESCIPLLWRMAPKFASLAERMREWVVPDLIPVESITLLSGDFGTFKSYLSYFLADAISSGGEFVKRECKQHPVLILDRENPHSTVYLRRGLVGNLRNAKNVGILALFTDPPAPRFTDSQLLQVCRIIKPVIIVDALTDFREGKKENDADDMSELFFSIRALIVAGAVAVIILHHVPKNGGTYRGSTAIPAAVDVAIEIEKNGKNTLKLKGYKQRDGENKEIELKLNFGLNAVTYDVINAGRDPGAELNDRILDYVAAHEDCSVEDVANCIHKRKADVSAAIDALKRIGKLVSNKGSRGNHAGLRCPAQPALFAHSPDDDAFK
jgi:5S rRNA maturation endonuclease (ribonuclease M5)